MQPNNEILIDYLDKRLNQEEAAQVESMVQKDTLIATELQYLKLAIDTTRLEAINQKVFAIRNSFDNNRTSTEKQAGAIVRNMYKISLRIAAVLIILIGITALYKYISVSGLSVYEKQFEGYELSNTRGVIIPDAEVEAYQNKNWREVISIHDKENNNTNKSNFLAAIAEMQLNEFPRAIALFENILKVKAGDTNFQEESEYYLFLAYLRNHEEIKALQILDKIKADSNHLYYPLVSKISPIDLKIIELKK